MIGAYDLLRDALPRDRADQVDDLHTLRAALGAQGHGRDVVVVLSVEGDAGAAALARGRGREVLTLTLAVPPLGPRGSETAVDGEPLPLESASVGLLACFGALESVADPAWLAAELARVLRPGGELVGATSFLEPRSALQRRLLPATGARLLLEEHGLGLVEVRPGIDGLAATSYWLHGRAPQFAPYFSSTSPANAEIDDWGRSTRRRPALVALRKLQFAGRYAWRARRAEGDGPTPWWVALRETGRPPEPPAAWRGASAGGAAPGAGAGGPGAPAGEAEEPQRRFLLPLPDPPPERLPPWRTPPVPAARVLRVSAPLHQYIPRELERVGLGGYEHDSLACFLAAAASAGRGWVYDVGANVGVYALVAAALTGRRVVAFEPTPVLAATARDLAARNGLLVDVAELALAEQPGTATFYLSDRTDASNSLAAGFRGASTTLEVTVDTVDAYARRTGRTPALMKVDTETTEPDVLRGALGTLRSARPWVLCEVLPGHREAELAEVMRPLGYRFYPVTGARRLPERTAPTADPHLQHPNWLLAPRRPGRAFWRRLGAWRAVLSGLGSQPWEGRDEAPGDGGPPG